MRWSVPRRSLYLRQKSALTADPCRNVHPSRCKHYQSAIGTHQVPNTPDAQAFIDEMILRVYTVNSGKGRYKKQRMIQIADLGEIYKQGCRNELEVFGSVLKKMPAQASANGSEK